MFYQTSSLLGIIAQVVEVWLVRTSCLHGGRFLIVVADLARVVHRRSRWSQILVLSKSLFLVTLVNNIINWRLILPVRNLLGIRMTSTTTTFHDARYSDNDHEFQAKQYNHWKTKPVRLVDIVWGYKHICVCFSNVHCCKRVTTLGYRLREVDLLI